MCSLVVTMVDEPLSLDAPVGDPFSFVVMPDEYSSAFWAVECCSKVVWTATSIRFIVVGRMFACLVLANTRLLT